MAPPGSSRAWEGATTTSPPSPTPARPTASSPGSFPGTTAGRFMCRGTLRAWSCSCSAWMPSAWPVPAWSPRWCWLAGRRRCRRCWSRPGTWPATPGRAGWPRHWCWPPPPSGGRRPARRPLRRGLSGGPRSGEGRRGVLHGLRRLPGPGRSAVRGRAGGRRGARSVSRGQAPLRPRLAPSRPCRQPGARRGRPPSPPRAPARPRPHAGGPARGAGRPRSPGPPVRLAGGDGGPGGGGQLEDRGGAGGLHPPDRPVEGHRDRPGHGAGRPRHGRRAPVSHVLVMAKAPQPGRVKTRLCPPCSPGQAAQVAEAALATTLAAVAASRAARRIVAVAGPPGPWLPPGFDVVAQRGAGLAERLANAWTDVGEEGVQIGMDTAQVTAADLDAALESLAAPGTDAVLGPAQDGGWWLLGLRVGLLDRRRDVDTWADATAVAATIPGTPFADVVRQVAATFPRPGAPVAVRTRIELVPCG